MASKKKTKSTDLKVKKKKWVEIHSPFFGDQAIGETSVVDIEQAIGKTLKINLMHLAGDPRKQNTNILFITDKQKGETAVSASITGYEIQQPTLRKMVRRGKSKVTDSFKCKTKDGKPVVIKLFVLTKSVVNNAVANTLRGYLKQKMVNHTATKNFDELIKELTTGKFQKDLKFSVSKVYPLRALEFNTVKIVPEKGTFVEVKELEELERKPKEKKDKEEAEAVEAEEKPAEETPKESEEKPAEESA